VSLSSPLTRQDKWAVLTRSMQLKLQHLIRTVPLQLSAALLQEHIAELRRAALQVLGQQHPDVDGLNSVAVHPQPDSPLRIAGFDVLHLPADLCTTAFVSSSARAEVAVQSAPPSLRPFTSTHSDSSAARNLLCSCYTVPAQSHSPVKLCTPPYTLNRAAACFADMHNQLSMVHCLHLSCMLMVAGIHNARMGSGWTWGACRPSPLHEAWWSQRNQTALFT
jgi:hypothetical protein